MAKHQKITTSSGEPSQELIRRVEKACLAFRAENPGERYRRADLNKVIKTSFGPLGRAARIVAERLDASEAKLAAMPRMPEDLRLAQEQFLKDLWIRARELGSAEADALRLAARKSEERHRVEMAEAHEIIDELEAERDEARTRAAAVEGTLAECQAETGRLVGELARAEAKLDERTLLMTLLHDATGVPSSRDGGPDSASDDWSGAGATADD